MSQKLIINADDYGHTPGVSEGIRRAHLQGIVTSTTAMMNRPASLVELPKALSLCPNLGLGVHLTLTTGQPLLPASQIPSLVDENGNFFNRETFIEHLSHINPDEAMAEWSAQVERFIQTTERSPDHLDSHHHSSYFTPALFERMLTLAAKLGCPIRKPFGEDSASAADYLPAGQPEKDFVAVQKLLARFKPTTTHAFCKDFYDESATLPRLIELIKQIAAAPSLSTWELMCHPAVVDDELRLISYYNSQRGKELQVLCDTHARALLIELEVDLIPFAKL